MLSNPSRQLVLRKQRVSVDLQSQQIADRVRVLLAIEPVQRDPFGSAVYGGLVQRALDPRDERIQLLFVRSRLLRGRHQVAAKLAHGFLENLRVRGNAFRSHRVERELTRELGAVVTLDAILVDHLPLLTGFGNGAAIRPRIFRTRR